MDEQQQGPEKRAKLDAGVPPIDTEMPDRPHEEEEEEEDMVTSPTEEHQVIAEGIVRPRNQQELPAPPSANGVSTQHMENGSVAAPAGAVTSEVTQPAQVVPSVAVTPAASTDNGTVSAAPAAAASAAIVPPAASPTANAPPTAIQAPEPAPKVASQQDTTPVYTGRIALKAKEAAVTIRPLLGNASTLLILPTADPIKISQRFKVTHQTLTELERKLVADPTTGGHKWAVGVTRVAANAAADTTAFNGIVDYFGGKEAAGVAVNVAGCTISLVPPCEEATAFLRRVAIFDGRDEAGEGVEEVVGGAGEKYFVTIVY
ncbi:hypothetical protein HK104_006870 [Borealophlyctis nickersoniae]|nr:hypothetical protein HK104_006870 [Borealophlyctis nickersoniae]